MEQMFEYVKAELIVLIPVLFFIGGGNWHRSLRPLGLWNYCRCRHSGHCVGSLYKYRARNHRCRNEYVR